MSSDDRKRILDYLIKEAQSCGTSVVRDAANGFLKIGLKSVVTPTIRKPIPREWTISAFTRQKGKCSRCHREMLMSEATGDHVIAITQGGHHRRDNITAMHRECNSSKNDSDLMRESKRSGNLMNEMFPQGDDLDG